MTRDSAESSYSSSKATKPAGGRRCRYQRPRPATALHARASPWLRLRPPSSRRRRPMTGPCPPSPSRSTRTAPRPSPPAIRPFGRSIAARRSSIRLGPFHRTGTRSARASELRSVPEASSSGPKGTAAWFDPEAPRPRGPGFGRSTIRNATSAEDSSDRASVAVPGIPDAPRRISDPPRQGWQIRATNPA